jgi:hypothetical protein
MRGADVSIWCSASLLAAALGGCSLVFPFDEGKLTGSGGAGGDGGSGGTGATTTGSGGTITSDTTTSSGMTVTSGTTGGSGGASTSSGAAAGGSGGTAQGPVVACNFPNVSDCLPGEVCCFDLASPIQDFCAAPEGCGSSAEYGELACEKADDCAAGLVCCGHFVSGLLVRSSYCTTACDLGNDEVTSCATDADCAAGELCDTMVGNEYPSYTFCNPD